MENQLLLAIDAGTTGIRTILYDPAGKEAARSYREFRQITPAPGLLEHDPLEIWEVTRGLIQESLRKARIEPSGVAAIGVTGQRATALVWDRKSGRPLHNALVWQDLRTYGRCQELSQMLGFTVSPIAALTKMEWLLQNVPGAREKVQEGEALIGTLDSWLVWKLTGGKAFVTDTSNACTTFLWNPQTGDWSPELAGLIGVPVERLAKLSPTSAVYGETHSAVFGAPVPVAAVAGDQQAAMFGHLCLSPGEGKATYGTSVMVDLNTGADWTPAEGIYPLALWRMGGQDLFCLEGTVITGGASVSWARDMRLLDSPQESSALAASVEDSGGTLFVPALQGLGTPYMEHAVQGGLLGLTRATTRAHVARALLEGIAFRTRQVVEALRQHAPGPAFPSLQVDGGMAENDTFLQIQADVLGVPVARPATSQVTALGIASLAGLAVGYWNSIDQLRAQRAPGQIFQPGDGAPALQERFADWQEAVEALRALARRTARS